MPPDTSTRRVEHELFLRSFFPVNPPAHVAGQITAAMRDVTFAPGEVIYTAGDPADRLFFIISGRVRLEARSAKPWHLADHSVIGIVDAGLERPYSRTATAVSRVHGIVLEFEEYRDAMEDNFDFARRIFCLASIRHNELALGLAPDGVFLDVPDTHEATPADADGVPGKMNGIERIVALRATPLLQRAPVQALAVLAQLAEQRRFEADEPLFDVGDPTDQLHVVIAGQVHVSRVTPRVSCTIGAHRLVGDVATLGYDRHFYNAVAKTRVLTLMIQREDLFDVAEDHFGLGRAIFAHIAKLRERAMRKLQRTPAPDEHVEVRSFFSGYDS